MTINFSAASTEHLLAAFEPGVTLDIIESRYHAGVLASDQLSAWLELMLRAERMTGHDFRIKPADREALSRVRGLGRQPSPT